MNYNGGGVALATFYSTPFQLLFSAVRKDLSETGTERLRKAPNEAFLEDGVVQVGVRRVIGPTFRVPIKWIFTVDRRMEGDLPQGQQVMRIKVAIRSLLDEDIKHSMVWYSIV